MDRPLKHARKTAALRNRRGHSGLRRGFPEGQHSMESEDRVARRAWAAMSQARKSLQARIVMAFRQHIEGTGPGPSEGQLRMFAKLAVAEHQLWRAMTASRTRHVAAAVQPPVDAIETRRGERP